MEQLRLPRRPALSPVPGSSEGQSPRAVLQPSQRLAVTDLAPDGRGRSHRSDNLCGRPVHVHDGKKDLGSSQGRSATIGGVIHLDDDNVYVMVSAHAVLGALGSIDDDDTDAESDGSGQDVRETRSEGDSDNQSSSAALEALQQGRHPIFVDTLGPDHVDSNAKEKEPARGIATESVYIGDIVMDTQEQEGSRYANADLDWAVVQVVDPDRFETMNHIEWLQKTIRPRFVAKYDLPNESEVLVLTQYPGVTPGQCTATKSMLMLPWVGFVEASIIECRTGACTMM
jgi:hypothetical protein